MHSLTRNWVSSVSASCLYVRKHVLYDIETISNRQTHRQQPAWLSHSFVCSQKKKRCEQGGIKLIFSIVGAKPHAIFEMKNICTTHRQIDYSEIALVWGFTPNELTCAISPGSHLFSEEKRSFVLTFHTIIRTYQDFVLDKKWNCTHACACPIVIDHMQQKCHYALNQWSLAAVSFFTLGNTPLSLYFISAVYMAPR